MVRTHRTEQFGDTLHRSMDRSAVMHVWVKLDRRSVKRFPSMSRLQPDENNTEASKDGARGFNHTSEG